MSNNSSAHFSNEFYSHIPPYFFRAQNLYYTEYIVLKGESPVLSAHKLKDKKQRINMYNFVLYLKDTF